MRWCNAAECAPSRQRQFHRRRRHDDAQRAWTCLLWRKHDESRNLPSEVCRRNSYPSPAQRKRKRDKCEERMRILAQTKGRRDHQPRLLGSRVRFPAGAFAIFFRFCQSLTSNFPFSFPFLFLSLSLRPSVCARKRKRAVTFSETYTLFLLLTLDDSQTTPFIFLTRPSFIISKLDHFLITQFHTTLLSWQLTCNERPRCT